MKKDSTLTAADLDNIVTENFAPDIKKLAHEVGANLEDPAVLRAIGTRIVRRYGKSGLRKVMDLVKIIYGGGRGTQTSRFWSSDPLYPVYQGTASAGRRQPKLRLSRGKSLPWSSF